MWKIYRCICEEDYKAVVQKYLSFSWFYYSSFKRRPIVNGFVWPINGIVWSVFWRRSIVMCVLLNKWIPAIHTSMLIGWPPSPSSSHYSDSLFRLVVVNIWIRKGRYRSCWNKPPVAVAVAVVVVTLYHIYMKFWPCTGNLIMN